MSELNSPPAGPASWGEQTKAAQAVGAPAPVSAGCDFGLETGECDLEERDFAFGDHVKIAKRAHVIDKERENEGPLAKLEGPLEADVTGADGIVESGSYYDPNRDDEMVPITTRRGALLYVPSKKLERADAPVRGGKNSFSLAPKMNADERTAAKKAVAEFLEAQAKALREFLERTS